MISRPITTREIKHKGKVYKLELWSPASDNVTDTSELFAPKFRKEYFDNMDMTDEKSPHIHSNKYQERFDMWFDRLSPEKQRVYARAIDESNRIIISMVWDLILPRDRHELFNDNLRQFSNWFSNLDVTDVDFYMSRIMSKQRLMPIEFTNNDNELMSESEITQVLSQVYDKIDDDLIRATSINGLLCISCTDETRLKKAKSHMIRHGSILRDYRKKENTNGRVIYTYIFSKP